jgi:hypothetical protein
MSLPVIVVTYFTDFDLNSHMPVIKAVIDVGFSHGL